MTVHWEKVYVFVSSTFNDMHAERDYLVKQVFPQLAEWCARRKLRLVDIDLRWGVTEADATENKRVVQVCLERIDACRPFFLCFLGQRRGWVPARADISEEVYARYPELEQYAGEASVTELEILHALVNPLHRGKATGAEYAPAEHSFFYLRQPEYLAALSEDLAQLRQVYTNEGIPNPEERRRADVELERWRTEAIPTTGRPVRSYAARWDSQASTPELRLPYACPSTAEPGSLAWKSALDRWTAQWRRMLGEVKSDGTGVLVDPADRARAEQFNARLTSGRLTDFTCNGQPLAEVILADLQAAIQARFSDHVETVDLTPLQRELDQQEQFLAQASEGFIERTGDFDGLDGYVEDDRWGTFFLTAPGGLGKTSLLARWIDHQQTSPGPGESLHYRFIGASDGSTTVDSLLRSLLTEIQELTGKLEGKEIPADPNELRSALPALLETAGAHGRTVLVLDGLNQLETGMADMVWLPLALPPGVKVIASFKRGEPRAEAYLERLRAVGEAILAEVRPFESLDDRRRLVRAYLSLYLKELDERHLEALIRSEGAGNPLFLKVVLAELRVFGAFADLGEKIRADFGLTPVSAFAGQLRRLESDPAYSAVLPERLVPRLLGWLAHARTGLTAEELGDLLVREGLLPDNEAGRQGALEAVHGLLRQVRPYLARREGRAGFFYESFKLAVLERYVRQAEAAPAHPESRSKQDWHASLAEYFAAQPLRIGPEQAPNRHKLAELAYQQAYAGMGEALEQTLWDYLYIQARLESHGIQSLIADYDLINLPEAGLSGEARRHLRLLHGALRLSAHVLRQDPAQLPSQLTGRLLGRQEPEFRNLLEDVRRKTTRPWLRPLTPSLTPPGGPLLYTLSGHSREVNAVAVTPDGRRAVSGSSDQTLRVWDLERGVELHTLRGHSDAVKTVAVTPDGRRAVSASRDMTLIVWDIDTGTQLTTLRGHTDWIMALSMTQDSQRVISASLDATVRVWSPDDGVESRTLQHKEMVFAVAITQDGRWAISGARDAMLRVWDLENGDLVYDRHVACPDVSILAVSGNGARILSGSYGGSMFQVWEIEQGMCLHTLRGHNGKVEALWLSSDGMLAVSASEDHTLRVWDLSGGLELYTLEGHTNAVRAIAVTSDEQRMVSASDDHTLRVWGLNRGLCLCFLTGHNASVNAIALTPDGRRAVSASKDGTLKVWDISDEALSTRAELINLNSLSQHWGTITDVAATLDGRRAISASVDNTLKIWDLESGEELLNLEGHSDWVTKATFTPDGQRAVSASRDCTLRVWDMETGAELFALEGHEGSVTAIAVTPDGRRLVSASTDETLRVWDLTKGGNLHVLSGHRLPVVHLELTPDGHLALSRSSSKVMVWDLAEGAALCFLPDRRKRPGLVMASAVVADGRKALIAYETSNEGSSLPIGTWSLWDLQSALEFLTSSSPTAPPTAALVASPDAQVALLALKSHQLVLVDLGHGVELRRLRGHRGLVSSVKIMPDAKRAVSTSLDTTLRMWDLESGDDLLVFSDEEALSTCNVSPDGLTIVAGGDTGIVHFLRLENVTPGPSVVTAWRAPVASLQRLVRRSAGPLAFGCPHCRTWWEVPESALGTELPCPHCGKVVCLNSFFIEADWRPVAAAWRGDS